MSVITDMQLAIVELQTQMANICRPATVTYVYRKAGEAGIKSDRDNGKHIGFVDVQSGELEIWRVPVLASHNGDDTSLWLPTENESGYLFSPSGDLGQAWFIAGAPTEKKPLPEPEGQATHSVVRQFREGNSEILIIKDSSGKVVNQYTLEIAKKNDSFTKFVHGDSVITLDSDEAKIEHGDSEIVIDSGGTLVKKGTTELEITGSTIKGKVGGIGRILATSTTVNIGGATFTNGATNMITPTGAVTYVVVPIT